jgi:hypothetical protein
MATIAAEPFDLDFDPATTVKLTRGGKTFIGADGPMGAISGWVSDPARAIAAMS